MNMAIHKLDLGEFDEIDYYLIAIHTSLEDYRLAYFINQKLAINLHEVDCVSRKKKKIYKKKKKRVQKNTHMIITYFDSFNFIFPYFL